MKLSVLIPAYNEEKVIANTVNNIYKSLKKNKILHEILVIDDNSSDNTANVLKKLKSKIPSLRYITKGAPNGFGFAVKTGLDNFTGDFVVIMMADGSDSVKDLISYHKMLEKGSDCVFGSRFIQGSKLKNYPLVKLIFNRLTNYVIMLLFNLRYNDVSNAFKGYNRKTINGLKPILSHHYNLTVELPLKAIIRGYNYKVVPISWKSRQKGASKLILKEMGSRYLFIVLYCLIEKLLSKGDYRKS